MKAFHMVEEHNKAPDLDKITAKLMLNVGSNNNNNSSNIRTIEENIGVRKGLNLLKIRCCSSWGGNKRILNMNEKRFSELENFEANTTVFQINTKASLRNLKTQVGQLALSLQDQSRNAFPSSTEIKPKDLTPTALRSNDELQGNKKM